MSSFVPNNFARTGTTGNSSVDVAIRKFRRAAHEYMRLVQELLNKYPNPRNVSDNNRSMLIAARKKLNNAEMNAQRRTGHRPPQ